MIRFFSVIIFVSFFFLFYSPTLAHPGRTASDGCHYCRTNCASWGEVEDARHCHGGGSTSTTTVTAPVVPVTAPSPVAVYSPRPLPSPSPVVVYSPRPAASSITNLPISCSDTTDSACPDNCTAGNDIDCCNSKQEYSWYDNWGCYPAQLSCSAESDGKCDSYCTAGNDADCCSEKLSDHAWFKNQGCYPADNATCSAVEDGICPASCETGHDFDCCSERLEGYTWHDNWGCYPE